MSSLALLKPFGIDLFCTGKKFLVYNMVGRNLKIKYRRSILGVFWTLLSPLSLVGIYYFVFKVILKVNTPHYLAYLVSGILPWSFFSSTIIEGLDSIAGNSNLISKIPIPLQVFPLVGTITNLVTLGMALPIMIGVSLLSGIQLGPSLILLPVFFLLIALMSYAVALTLGILFIYLDDLKHVTGLAMQLWFYATPVLYHSEMIPQKYQWFLYLNPVGTSFVALHQILSDGIWPDPKLFVCGLAWTAVTILISLQVHRSLSQGVAENL